MNIWIERIRRGLRRPPDEILRRAAFEARALLDRTAISPDMPVAESLLRRLPYPNFAAPSAETRARIAEAARRARLREVDLLGSGPHILPDPIDWHIDFKSGYRWPIHYFRDLNLNDLTRDSDVKVPWELSRLQWLIPVGQDYALGGDPSHAGFARDVLLSWMDANPFARGVNWAIAMEPAMRIFTWTWLFQTLGDSAEWREPVFRRQFLATLYRHGEFVSRYIEDFGTGGNHLIADAAGLVMAGIFFGANGAAAGWHEQGWSILTREIERQVGPDGVDYEASMAYHRFVADLLDWPARTRTAHGFPVPEGYKKRLAAMMDFTAAARGPDGQWPLWGDDDSGRVLPLDGIEEPVVTEPVSRSFETGGAYILAHERDHVFIDCGPVGQAGRGGHGHNDVLSFEAVLNGVRLITDSGSFVYTASATWRNRFRSALAHNAPVVDGEEPNRFVAENELFLLHDDATPRIELWRREAECDVFMGSHSGYMRLPRPVRPVRRIELDKTAHRLRVRDTFEGEGDHRVVTTLHFAPGIAVVADGTNRWRLTKDGVAFDLTVATHEWQSEMTTSYVSPAYGVRAERSALAFSHAGPLAAFEFEIAPVA